MPVNLGSDATEMTNYARSAPPAYDRYRHVRRVLSVDLNPDAPDL